MRMMKLQPVQSIILVFVVLALPRIYGQQITIDRVEPMPNMPTPYEMRDWEEVARGYDSLVFDFDSSGQYLPLIFWRTNTVNYPAHNSFGLHTVVSTTSPGSGEAINVLPAVISATLAGIDKSNQNGNNWVLMCEEFFNRRPEENVYLNHPIAQSGSDWWYDTMPNVFFYQLYDLYPRTGDFDYQLTTVAQRWRRAVRLMGGSTNPWQVPNMDYRAWELSTMTPNTGGVEEPEAAGAIAWLLYHAYKQTGNDEFRIGAEWAMEFLNNRNTNPSYELQLPYGAYLAAKMNAELGTTYDVEQLVEWCFTPDGNVRQWGVTLGNWGGYDCYGLVGEALYDGYAFAMNTFEHVGALVPMVRYDDRFARSIGKWVLNAANAARLFYPNYLPPENQDSESWSYEHDPHSYIAHESMREEWNGISPYATGDAVVGGWGQTNLALYGSSHVGIFGGIIDTTEVRGVLQLDLLKTDYFRDDAYPSYLYYNPYTTDTTITIAVGDQPRDIYDAVTNTVLITNVTGEVSMGLPADAAVLAVLTPSGGTVEYELEEMLIDGITVDYNSDNPVPNYPPRLKALSAEEDTVLINSPVLIYYTADDRDNDTLSYSLEDQGSTITSDSSVIEWQAPGASGEYTLSGIVTDDSQLSDTLDITIHVIENIPPEIESINAVPSRVGTGEAVNLTCNAVDSDNDSLIYQWFALTGGFEDSVGTHAVWRAPDTPGYYYVSCRIEDEGGWQVSDSVGISVGHLIADLSFQGNARDSSGFGNHGSVYGASLTTDHHSNEESAYAFDGQDDFIRILNHPSLDTKEEISVLFWMKVNEFYERESYPISHGNWERRWKVSIIPDRRLRWTIKTDASSNNGIIDLDSEQPLQQNRYYHVACTYNGDSIRIYLDGDLNNSAAWSGFLRFTDVDLTIGQVLPDNNQYNLNGVIDEVRIYDIALTGGEIRNIYQETVDIGNNSPGFAPDDFRLTQNFPNPFNNSTRFTFSLPTEVPVTISIYDTRGLVVNTLVSAKRSAGHYTVDWNGTDNDGKPVASGLYFVRMEAGDYLKTRKLLLVK